MLRKGKYLSRGPLTESFFNLVLFYFFLLSGEWRLFWAKNKRKTCKGIMDDFRVKEKKDSDKANQINSTGFSLNTVALFITLLLTPCKQKLVDYVFLNQCLNFVKKCDKIDFRAKWPKDRLLKKL